VVATAALWGGCHGSPVVVVAVAALWWWLLRWPCGGGSCRGSLVVAVATAALWWWQLPRQPGGVLVIALVFSKTFLVKYNMIMYITNFKVYIFYIP